MLKQIYKNNLTVNFKTEGKGDVIVLIHGFLETHEIWSEFSKDLSKFFKVISVDLPGHGGSSLHSKPYTMCKLAESVHQITEHENIDKAFIIGHSMGGYAALAFAENYPEKLSGLCLFHSSPFADTPEKKEKRTETIKHFKSGQKEKICNEHVKMVYAKDNLDKFDEAVKQGINIAKSISTEGIIASIETMRDRNDRHIILKNCKAPFLFITGMKDNFIPSNIVDFISMPEKHEVLILENSGHMGMTEEKGKSINAVIDFYNRYIRT